MSTQTSSGGEWGMMGSQEDMGGGRAMKRGREIVVGWGIRRWECDGYSHDMNKRNDNDNQL